MHRPPRLMPSSFASCRGPCPAPPRPPPPRASLALMRPPMAAAGTTTSRARAAASSRQPQADQAHVAPARIGVGRWLSWRPAGARNWSCARCGLALRLQRSPTLQLSSPCPSMGWSLRCGRRLSPLVALAHRRLRSWCRDSAGERRRRRGGLMAGQPPTLRSRRPPWEHSLVRSTTLCGKRCWIVAHWGPASQGARLAASSSPKPPGGWSCMGSRRRSAWPRPWPASTCTMPRSETGSQLGSRYRCLRSALRISPGTWRPSASPTPPRRTSRGTCARGSGAPSCAPRWAPRNRRRWRGAMPGRARMRKMVAE
mmetsp:Transcript_69282/g.225703  ORF Transcript_69282/g.225703 Transcript_69282/m.225703 type:complete len:312 (-) Transcript_69282:53-988(-)